AVEPRRGFAVGDPSRGTARDGHDVERAALRVREPCPVRRPARWPVQSYVTRGQPVGPSAGKVEEPDAGRVAVEDERRLRPVGRERERGGTRGVRNRVETPGRGE